MINTILAYITAAVMTVSSLFGGAVEAVGNIKISEREHRTSVGIGGITLFENVEVEDITIESIIDEFFN